MVKKIELEENDIKRNDILYDSFLRKHIESKAFTVRQW